MSAAVAVAGRRVLLLQGPVGPFFGRLARELRAGGASVTQVAFNGGDWVFSGPGALAYTGRPQQQAAFLARVLDERQIDTVLLFGDCRPVHRAIHALAAQRGIAVGVFEEGYVRPDYITFEPHGVNGRSRMSRDPGFYRFRAPPPSAPAQPIGSTFWHAALWAFLYYLASILLQPVFRHYQHHRPLNATQCLPWLRSVWRKQRYRWRERDIAEQLAGPLAGRYFLVPLQVHNDAQMQVHSRFASVAGFIEHSVRSFAAHAAPQHYLVVKQHPMDRGYHDYAAQIDSLRRELGLGARLLYIHDQHLPTLLAHAHGVVLVNSTVGMSALDHGCPLKACGEALYDMQGLSFQGSLDLFWQAAQAHRIDRLLYTRYRAWLVAHTQINASFYRQRPARARVTAPPIVVPVAPCAPEPCGAADSAAR